MKILNGLLGFFIILAILISLVVFLGYTAVMIQKSQSQNYYTIENKAEIKMDSRGNSSHYKLIK